MIKEVYIYALHDNTGIRYIGKADNVEQRFKHHYYEAFSNNRKEHNLRKSRWFRKHVNEIKYLIIEKCSTAIWAEREKYWINIFKKSLVNVANGGNGGSGKKSILTRERITAKALGRKASTETKFKMSISRKRAITEGRVVFDHNGTKNPRAYPIIQLNLNGNKIREWKYAKLASKKLGINYNSIISCINGKQKTAGGFLWKKYIWGQHET